MLTLLMFVEGKKCIRSAGGEKEKENRERWERRVTEEAMVCERKIERRRW